MCPNDSTSPMHPLAQGSKGMRGAHNENREKKERKEKNANSFCNFFQPAHNARPEKFLQLRQVEKRIWEFLTFELIKTDEFKKTVQASQYDGLGGFPTSCHDAILYLHCKMMNLEGVLDLFSQQFCTLWV